MFEFVCVNQGKLIDDGVPVAVKQITVHSYKSITDIWKERDLGVQLSHENICRFYGAFFDHDVFLLLEVCYGTQNNFQKQIWLFKNSSFQNCEEFLHENFYIHSHSRP